MLLYFISLESGNLSIFWLKLSQSKFKKELSLNRKDLRALTLVGPTRQNPVPDPLAVLHFYNQLFITKYEY